MVTPLTFLLNHFPFSLPANKSCPLYNFDTVRDKFTKLGTSWHRNRAHSVTLIPFEIISRNLVQIKV